MDGGSSTHHRPFKVDGISVWVVDNRIGPKGNGLGIAVATDVAVCRFFADGLTAIVDLVEAWVDCSGVVVGSFADCHIQFVGNRPTHRHHALQGR